MEGTSDLLALTGSMTVTTIFLVGVAWLIPRVVGDEPSQVIGIRTRATMSSREAWQAAHRAAEPLLSRTVWATSNGLFTQVIIGLLTGFDSMPTAIASVMVCVVAFTLLMYSAVKGNAAAKALRS